MSGNFYQTRYGGQIKSSVPPAPKEGQPFICATNPATTQRVLRTEWKIFLPEHIRKASERVEKLMVGLLTKENGSITATERAMERAGGPSELTCEEIGRAIFRMGKVWQSKKIDMNTYNNALQSLHTIRKLAHMKDLIETGSIPAANKWYVESESAKGLRSIDMQHRVDWIRDRLYEGKAIEGDNPKMGLGWEIFINAALNGEKCLFYCRTEEQKWILNAEMKGDGRKAFVSNHPLGGKSNPDEVKIEEVDKIVLYNPDRNCVKKVWENKWPRLNEIVVLVARGTADEQRYWNQAREKDRERPLPGKQFELSFD